MNLSLHTFFGCRVDNEYPRLQVVAVEQLLGVDCDEAVEEYRLAGIKAREEREPGRPTNGGRDKETYYELLEARVRQK